MLGNWESIAPEVRPSARKKQTARSSRSISSALQIPADPIGSSLRSSTRPILPVPCRWRANQNRAGTAGQGPPIAPGRRSSISLLMRANSVTPLAQALRHTQQVASRIAPLGQSTRPRASRKDLPAPFASQGRDEFPGVRPRFYLERRFAVLGAPHISTAAA